MATRLVTLDEIGCRHGTDKASFHHDYLKYYESFLDREMIGSMLEIGVHKGASLSMWRDWLPSAIIVGIDSKKLLFKPLDDKMFVERGDQSDEEFLHQIGSSFGPFDLIIDDGSHDTVEQHISWYVLHNYLSPHGRYVIEDVRPEVSFPDWQRFAGNRGEELRVW